MGLLSAAQMTAILAGAKMRQVWKIYAPESAGGAMDAVTIHDDADLTKLRVTDAGTREVFGYNISLMEPGKFEVGSYTFEVDNHDGYFCPEKAGNAFYNTDGSYQAMPNECDVEHKVYVWDAAADDWSELTMVNYRGKIEDIAYTDSGGPSAAVGLIAEITCVSSVSRVLDMRWTEEDSWTVDTGSDILG